MGLSVEKKGGLWVVNNVTAKGASAPLGRVYATVGAHYVGFDDRFDEPLVVRAYLDPTIDDAILKAQRNGEFDHLGYVQVAELGFRSIPIPPAVYGGRLAEREAYRYGAEQRFLDYMGPADARARMFDVPFYACNAALADPSLSEYRQLTDHPLGNGSLYWPKGTGENRSLCASLVASVVTSLVTPADVRAALTPERLLLSISATRAELKKKEAYRIALDHLRTHPLPDRPKASPPLAKVDETTLAAEVVGDLVLISLPPSLEEEPPTLCVGTKEVDASTVEVVVHVLTVYDVQNLTRDTGLAALQRICSYLADSGLVSDLAEADLDRPQPRRRASGLPFHIPPGTDLLELRYSTLAYGHRAGVPTRMPRSCFGGFTWSLIFRFDNDTASLSPVEVRAPKALGAFDIQPAIDRYRQAVARPQPRDTVDRTIFTRARMRRENFAAGRRLRFSGAFKGV
ncbi:hypothetical protein [Actinokineospora sp. UTMC 2448]|uniref:hypothetical protein n=1 Tax=Actinokineospora sp. UTMC 2448 TaxID=2268449 RepID=UPI002164635A|nr:hypothetical protein [Actinokineospora sp. UTMC 2448]UVS79470.1 hypothetical protein Actkin_03218 [Actinokineospora sp. UTMC 2448]